MAKSKKGTLPPLNVRFGDKDPIVVPFDPKEKQAILLDSGEGHLLVIGWDLAENGSGSYRVTAVGVDENGLIQKELEPGRPMPAFFGEVAVVGANRTDLFASFSYVDEDDRDSDGFVVNKVKEVRIKPVQPE